MHTEFGCFHLCRSCLLFTLLLKQFVLFSKNGTVSLRQPKIKCFAFGHNMKSKPRFEAAVLVVVVFFVNVKDSYVSMIHFLFRMKPKEGILRVSK